MLLGTLFTAVLSIGGMGLRRPDDRSASSTCSPSFLASAIDLPGNGSVIGVAAEIAETPGHNATISFCNVTVTYTHPGWNDTIHISVNLPQNNWNGRFQGVGGGGWATSSGISSLLSPVANGYAAGCTDGGHEPVSGTSAAWANLPDGQLNMHLFRDFAYLALNDLAVVGKQITHRYYGHGPHHSYWSGCSTGGRQGMMMAQRFPTAYDGIYAAAPAINWPVFIVAEYWSQLIMNRLDHYPPQCVLDTITAAAVEACSSRNESFISEPGRCMFDPHVLIGLKANCVGSTVPITAKDAFIAQKLWEGVRTPDGQNLWWGLNPGAPFSGLTNTSCSSGLTNCTGSPFSISEDWIARWVLQDPHIDLQTLTNETYFGLFSKAFQEYNGIIGTNKADLSAFKKNGGKIVTWHGLADQLIFPGAPLITTTKSGTVILRLRTFIGYFLPPAWSIAWAEPVPTLMTLWGLLLSG
ncbi:hypothetical protein N7468_005004 [Penicillium chermesinum]|uniref:Carboxylic ester hydrolase n=1 Tax=Penicillium chermesinum TaxID=63820 RepID=A0A9W9P117_9EURO|nr:uncharacterized protein N7468_005004 [Penicillium chermesinum]KAJ5232048.1 hypothetical protein N7468_005004 [Penicillium chermesinum]